MSSVVTCVYCGHEYPDGTPASQHERLTAHIRVCDKHPMRPLESENAQLKERVKELEAELDQVESMLTGNRLAYEEAYMISVAAKNDANALREENARLREALGKVDAALIPAELYCEWTAALKQIATEALKEQS